MKSKKIVFSLPFILASIAIFIASHQDGAPFDDSLFAFQDKVLHFSAYFIYGVTIQLYLLRYRLYKHKYIIYTILIGSLFGISDEIHQYFIPNRSTDVFDWIADTMGVTASLSISVYLKKIFNFISNKYNLK
mgnify:CR=1 FL=1